MPTYQYRCKDCGYEFEEFQSIVDDPLELCPRCDGSIHRIISGGAGLIFKGSGFYITDYRNSKYKADAAKDKTGATSAAASKATPSPSGQAPAAPGMSKSSGKGDTKGTSN